VTATGSLAAVQVFEAPQAMRDWSREQRASGHTIGVVPTMGALHDGHLALVAEARRRAARVVVTIFVNPLQFNQPADFDRYPRPIDDDLQACLGAGVDAVYAPTASVMYPSGFQTHVEPGALADRLEGPMRPGHFRGVTTVVTKLFGATQPDVAVFGQKDFQQLAIIRRMVADLDLGIEIVGLATVRELDGLARSSRNIRLTAEDRSAAVVIPRALGAAVDAFDAGERNVATLRQIAIDTLATERRASVEYVELVDASTLEPVVSVEAPAVILTAAWFGDVRLIDNRMLESAR
jgi:pantoate--beta-alanine ligase